MGNGHGAGSERLVGELPEPIKRSCSRESFGLPARIDAFSERLLGLLKAYGISERQQCTHELNRI